LSPRQIAIIPVNLEAHGSIAKDLQKELYDNGIYNIILDDREEGLSYKIRDHQTKKTNLQVVIGDKEIKDKNITYREYGSEKEVTVKKTEFIKKIIELNKLPL
jgi:threonyl-tRNA synthetase